MTELMIMILFGIAIGVCSMLEWNEKKEEEK